MGRLKSQSHTTLSKFEYKKTKKYKKMVGLLKPIV